MPNGNRERTKRFVVRGTVDTELVVLEAECIRIQGGWIVRAGCCSSFVSDDDAHKLYTSHAKAVARVGDLIDGGMDP